MGGRVFKMKLPFLMNVTNEIEKMRADSFWTKEPETIEIIKDFSNHIMPARPYVFLDVGANVGIYSLYAASLYPDMIIISVEPETENYKALLENIKLNNFKNIIPLQVAIDGFNSIKIFSVDKKIKSGNSSGALNAHNVKKNNKKIISMSIDAIKEIVHYVDFLKIDIDGGEFQAISGMMSTLEKKEIITMLIEISIENLNKYTLAMDFIENNGYSASNRFNSLYNHSSFRRAKENINVTNVVFVRN